jgi:ferredoxin-type protein NapG
MSKDGPPLDRRAFFTQGFRRVMGKAVDTVSERIAPSSYVRPPGALPEAAFLGACTRCGKCTEVCPANAISPLSPDHGLAAGTPALDVASRACVMCDDIPCASICPTDALEVPGGLWKVLRLSAISIDTERCIAWRDVSCGVCAQACPLGTAALDLDHGGRPVVGAACTGCGVCINACVTLPSSILSKPIGRFL